MKQERSASGLKDKKYADMGVTGNEHEILMNKDVFEEIGLMWHQPVRFSFESE